MSPTDERLDLQVLYERYGHAVFRRCRYFLRNDEDARDAMHEVFIKAAKAYDLFRGQSSPLTWLVRIATHHCLNLIRARKASWHDRYATVVQVTAESDPGLERFERAELVHRLLRKLPREEQEAAVYYFVDEMSQDEAAHACDCSVPTLRKRLRHFIEMARKELSRDDVGIVFGEAPI